LDLVPETEKEKTFSLKTRGYMLRIHKKTNHLSSGTPIFRPRSLEGIMEESREICERKTLFRMKKEADQAGFKGTGISWRPGIGLLAGARRQVLRATKKHCGTKISTCTQLTWRRR